MQRMEDKITLDRETFRALAVDTRINILKKLDDEHQLTLTDLAERLGMAPSTIKEHLERLVEVGLIEQIDKGTKWKYYRLTRKGKQLLNPYEKKVWIVLSASMLLLFASLYRLFYKLNDLVTASIAPSMKVNVVADHFMEEPSADGFLGAAAQENISTTVTTLLEKEADYATTTFATARKAFDEAVSTVSTTIPVPKAVEAVPELPYAELTISLILVLLAGICVGYLIRRKRII